MSSLFKRPQTTASSCNECCLVSRLAKSDCLVEERTLVSRPNYDMRGLLGGPTIVLRCLAVFGFSQFRCLCPGTEHVVNSMIRWCVQELLRLDFPNSVATL